MCHVLQHYVQQSQTGKLKTCVTLKSSDIYYKMIFELEHMSIFSLEYWELSLKKPGKSVTYMQLTLSYFTQITAAFDGNIWAKLPKTYTYLAVGQNCEKFLKIRDWWLKNIERKLYFRCVERRILVAIKYNGLVRQVTQSILSIKDSVTGLIRKL